MHMRVMGHGRPPTVQDGDYAELGAEALGIGRNGEGRLGRGLEQDIVDDRLVVIGEAGDGSRHSIDEMEIGYRQQLGFALRQPFPRCRPLALGAMAVAAGVVGDGCV